MKRDYHIGERIRMPKLSGIYQVQSLVNNKLFIGSASDLNQCERNFYRRLKNGIFDNKTIQRHFNRCGRDSLDFSILEYCSKKELKERKQYWIDELKPEFNVYGTKTSKN